MIHTWTCVLGGPGTGNAWRNGMKLVPELPAINYVADTVATVTTSTTCSTWRDVRDQPLASEAVWANQADVSVRIRSFVAADYGPGTTVEIDTP